MNHLRFTIYDLRFDRAWTRLDASRITHHIATIFLCLTCLLAGCSGNDRAFVVAYVSQDQVYAEPILREFTRQTGIDVRTVFDSEAVKTVGLANRLLVERAHPQCDVFWGNEALRTHQLAAQEVFRETDPWREMGYRSRRLVINTNCLQAAAAPATFRDLTNSTWRRKIALAYPLFGTTATHFLALRQHWGEARWTGWCKALQTNQPLLVDGNSIVVKLVGRGEAWIGLTDSDDVAAGRREGLPIEALPLDEDSLLIPNTIGVIRNARHPDAAQKLFEYLQRVEVLDQLVRVHALEGKSPQEIKVPTLKVHWDELVRDLDAATIKLKEIFLR